MPRRYNPRAISREAKTMRVEHMRDTFLNARKTRCEARRVAVRLAGVEAYGRLTKAYINVLVQDAIDDVELRHTNHERVKNGIPPYKNIDELNNPPSIFTEKDFLPCPTPYRLSDYE